MQKLMHVLHTIDLISEWTGKVVSFLVPAIVAIMVYEVVARYAFSAPAVWSHDMTLFFFGAAVVIGGAYTLRYDAHVRVDVLYARWSPRKKAVYDLATFVFFFSFCLIILLKGAGMAWISLEARELGRSVWAPPVYPAKMLVPIGASLILLAGLAKFIRNLITAVTGK